MKRSISSSSKDDIFRQAVADANRMQRKRTYPLNEATRALIGLDDLFDKIGSKWASHFTRDEWETLARAYDILEQYIDDIRL